MYHAARMFRLKVLTGFSRRCRKKDYNLVFLSMTLHCSPRMGVFVMALPSTKKCIVVYLSPEPTAKWRGLNKKTDRDIKLAVNVRRTMEHCVLN